MNTYDGEFVQVRVDLDDFSLKVSRCKDKVWCNNYRVIPITDDIIDLGVDARGEPMDTERNLAEGGQNSL